MAQRSELISKLWLGYFTSQVMGSGCSSWDSGEIVRRRDNSGGRVTGQVVDLEGRVRHDTSEYLLMEVTLLFFKYLVLVVACGY